MGRIHKEYYSANARFLSVEAIKDIKTSPGRVPDAINSMAKKYRISYVRAEDYIENQERKQQMIYSHSSQPSILVNDYLPNTEIPGQNINNDFHLDSQSQDTKITLHSSADIPDKQTKKRRSKSKSVRISDPSTNSDSQLEK
ncbi:17503_t:CDS:1, partial [Entrophospora sp. SA101]